MTTDSPLARYWLTGIEGEETFHGDGRSGEAAGTGGSATAAGQSPGRGRGGGGAPRQTVYRWLDVLASDGLDALRVMSKGGRPARLDAKQHEELRRVLLVGPQQSGFGTELWTLKRMRETIQRRFGVRYSEVHVWRLLGKLGFSSQEERQAE